MARSRSRSLPLHPTVSDLQQEMATQLGHRDATDIRVVGLDDPLPFSCARSGNCCSGRNMQLANLVTPREFGAMMAALRASGEAMTASDIVPRLVARVATAPERAVTSASGPQSDRKRPVVPRRRPVATTRSPRAGEMQENPDVSITDPGVAFAGLYFRMTPDAHHPDGDRCVFRTTDAEGMHGCRWHGTRAQPSQCALAPLALGELMVSTPEAPQFLWFESRKTWCTGMRLAIAGERPSTSARAILDANFGADRLADLTEYTEARHASRGWTDGFMDHYSPLARLYIAHEPTLEPVLRKF